MVVNYFIATVALWTTDRSHSIGTSSDHHQKAWGLGSSVLPNSNISNNHLLPLIYLEYYFWMHNMSNFDVDELHCKYGRLEHVQRLSSNTENWDYSIIQTPQSTWILLLTISNPLWPPWTHMHFFNKTIHLVTKLILPQTDYLKSSLYSNHGIHSHQISD